MGTGQRLFIATSLAVIVGSSAGGFAGAIVLYETALGVGIAAGPLVGGLLGTISWRGPFFGVAVLMLIALVATIVLVEPTPRPEKTSSIIEPIAALRHRSLATTSVTGLLYNWAFFTILGYAPFLMHLSAIKLGFVFFGWGILVALFAVFGAPMLKSRYGTPKTLYGALLTMAVISLVIGIWSDHRWVVIGAVIASGIVVGLNNTLVTTAVMSIAPVPRPVASATYGFVRFIGGGWPLCRGQTRRALQRARALRPGCRHRCRRRHRPGHRAQSACRRRSRGGTARFSRTPGRRRRRPAGPGRRGGIHPRRKCATRRSAVRSQASVSYELSRSSSPVCRR